MPQSTERTVTVPIPPQRIKHSSIGKDTDESVLDGDVVEEGLFGVNDEGVRDPEELHQPPVQAQAFVALKDQTLICPALSQEYGCSVVLQ